MYRRKNTYKGDPYWTTAKFTSKCCRCGESIHKGDNIFYYPKGKKVYCDRPDCGEREYAAFESAAQDEYFYNNY